MIKEIKHLIQSTSCHGISHLSNASNKKLAFFWALCSLCCTGAMIYFILERISDFTSASVNTSFEKLHLDELIFPDITVCSLDNYDETDYLFIFDLIKKPLLECLQGNYWYDKTTLTMFLIDYLNLKVLKSIEGSKRDTKYLQTKKSPYTTTIIRPTVLEDHDSGSKIFDSFDMFYLYPHSAWFECVSNDNNITEKTWEEEIQIWRNLCSPRSGLSGTTGSSKTNSNTNIKTEQADRKWECQIYNQTNFTVPEKCKYLIYGPMVGNPDQPDYGYFNQLIVGGHKVETLSAEIIFEFIHSDNITELFIEYGIYFETMLESYFDLTSFIEDVENLKNGDHDLDFRTVLDNYKNYFSSKAFYTNNTLPTTGYLSFLVMLESLKFDYLNYHERISKSAWMTQVTNLKNKLPQNNLTYYSNNQYLAANLFGQEYNSLTSSNTNISESYIFGNIENYKISNQERVLENTQFFKPNYNILKVNFGDINKSYRPEDIFESVNTAKSSRCFKTKKDLFLAKKTNEFIQTTGGEKNGLLLVLFTGYVGYNLNEKNLDFAFSPKFEISIDRPNSTFSDLIDSSIVIENGKLAKIGLTENYFKKSASMKRCEPSQDITFEECKERCFIDTVYASEECHCAVNHGLGYLQSKQSKNYGLNQTNSINRSECTFEDLINPGCYEIISQFKNYSITEIEQICDCGEPCLNLSYGKSISVGLSNLQNRDLASIQLSRIFTDEILNNPNSITEEEYKNLSEDSQFFYLSRTLRAYSLNNGIPLSTVFRDPDLLSQGLAIVQIYFDKLVANQVTEEAADPASSLISDLGGQLGLWMGISMVSIMEVFVIFYVGCRKLFKKIRIGELDREREGKGKKSDLKVITL